jgi:hypothetical protein
MKFMRAVLGCVIVGGICMPLLYVRRGIYYFEIVLIMFACWLNPGTRERVVAAMDKQDAEAQARARARSVWGGDK